MDCVCLSILGAYQAVTTVLNEWMTDSKGKDGSRLRAALKISYDLESLRSPPDPIRI